MSESDDEAFQYDSDPDEEVPADDDDDSDDGIVMEPAGERLPGTADYDFPYTVLKPEEIVRAMCTMIKEVEQVVHLPPTVCRILLAHYKWNKESLLEHYYECGEPESLFRAAQVVSPLTRHHGSTEAAAASTSRTLLASSSSSRPTVYRPPAALDCPICLNPCQYSEATGLQCGHRFCTECWRTYLTAKIMDEGKGQQISCMQTNCDILVDDELVMRLVADEQVRRRYQHLITESFVAANRRMRWCPAADCGNALQAECVEMRLVRCSCGDEFCFKCGRQWHQPVPCDLLARWIKKCSDDSETSNWIYTNTKECPKCKVVIEKNGGCNHMTCKSMSCRYEFCWMCLGGWEPHGNTWYNCNRYEDKGSRDARTDADLRRAALKRYLHYWNRYQAHEQSATLENKLYATVKHKMEQMQGNGQMSWIEVQYLRRAVDSLCACRRTLMYTYVFAYYLQEDNQTSIFEENQRDLEMSTEVLSGYLERELESDAAADLVLLKQNVQDKAAYVQQRREALVKHCDEGMDNDWWKYRTELF